MTDTAIHPENSVMKDLRAEVQAEIGRFGLSQAAVCKEAGVHPSMLSPWLKGKYSGDNGKADGDMRRWLAHRANREQKQAIMPPAPGFTATPTAQRIIAALTYAQMSGDLVVIYGGAGVGKSSSLRHYAANTPNVWILESTPSNGTLGGFLRALSWTLALRIPKGHGDTLELVIRDRLRGTGGLLMIDEAQFLNERALEAARRLAELAGIGLALSGNETVYTQLSGRNRAAEFAQLFSRIGKRVRLNRPSIADVQALLGAWGIGGKSEQQLVKEIAHKPGALRGVTKTLRLASMFAAGKKEILGMAHIRAAWKDLGGEL